MRWKIADTHSNFVIVERASATAEEKEHALSPRDAALRVQPLLGRLREHDVQRLEQLLGEAPPPSSRRRAITDGTALRDKLARKLTDRQLFVVDHPRRRVVRLLEDPGNVLGPQEEPTSWIAIELVDDDGNPVPNTPFKITDADGKIWNGTTDMMGKARFDGMNPGTCKVTFPSLDAADWAKA